MSSNIKINRLCQNCGNEFVAKTTTTLYCSRRCNSVAYKAKIREAKIEQSNIETLQTKNKTITELNSKDFLSITETCKLIGISRRTVYRMIARGELNIGKAGKRTIIRRSDLEQVLFDTPQDIIIHPIKESNTIQYDILDCYTLTEVQSKYGVSESTLQNIIKRNEIPKIKKGWFAYVPKITIDRLLS